MRPKRERDYPAKDLSLATWEKKIILLLLTAMPSFLDHICTRAPFSAACLVDLGALDGSACCAAIEAANESKAHGKSASVSWSGG